MVRIEAEYLGDLRIRSQHVHSGTELLTDAPLDNQGKGESFSPTDLCATALMTCVGTIIGIKARSMDLNVDGFKMFIEKEMSSDSPRRIGKLTGGFEFVTPVEPRQRESLIRAAKGCPVHHSLHPDIRKVLTFRWADGAVDVVEM